MLGRESRHPFGSWPSRDSTLTYWFAGMYYILLSKLSSFWNTGNLVSFRGQVQVQSPMPTETAALTCRSRWTTMGCSTTVNLTVVNRFGDSRTAAIHSRTKRIHTSTGQSFTSSLLRFFLPFVFFGHLGRIGKGWWILERYYVAIGWSSQLWTLSGKPKPQKCNKKNRWTWLNISTSVVFPIVEVETVFLKAPMPLRDQT